MRDNPAGIRQAFKGSVAAYTATGAEVLSAFVVSVLVVRSLDVAEYGSYKLAASVILVGALLCSCGLESTLQRFGAEFVTLRQWSRLRRFVKVVRNIRISAILMFCLIIYGFRDQIGAALNLPGSLIEALPLVLLLLWFQSSNSLWGQTFFMVRSAFVEINLARILVALLRLAAIYAVCRANMGLTGVLAALLIAQCGGSVFYFVRNARWWRRVENKETNIQRTEGTYRKRAQRYAMYSYLAVNAGMFRDLSLDQFVIAYFMDEKSVAAYGLASTLVVFAAYVNPAAVLRGIVNQMFISKHTEGGSAAPLIKGHEFLTKLVICVYFPALTVLILLGDKIISIVYSEQYMAAYPPLVWLCGCYFFFGLTYTFLPLISALEKNALIAMAAVTSLYNIVMDIALVPIYGISGAAVATGTAGVLQLTLYYFAFKRVYDIDVRLPVRPIIGAVINLLPGVIVLMWLKPLVSGVTSLFAALIAFAIVYLIVLYANHTFNAYEVAIIRKALRQRA